MDATVNGCRFYFRGENNWARLRFAVIGSSLNTSGSIKTHTHLHALSSATHYDGNRAGDWAIRLKLKLERHPIDP